VQTIDVCPRQIDIDIIFSLLLLLLFLPLPAAFIEGGIMRLAALLFRLTPALNRLPIPAIVVVVVVVVVSIKDWRKFKMMNGRDPARLLPNFGP
jgi:hypothetical protein